jgi:ribosome-binding protein aMBF1 (putative translation factor)
MDQDWKPVIIKKSINKENKKIEKERLIKDPNVIKEQIKKSKTEKLSKSITDDGNIPDLNYVSKEMKSIIRKSRTESNLSQEQLANLCNLDKNVIANIENPIMKVVYCPKEINIISKVLKVHVPRK